MRYRSCRPDDAAARARLRELASVRRRFGYRRLHILLTRVGIVMNHKKLRRLYREERFQVRRRGGRKRAPGTRVSIGVECRLTGVRVGWGFRGRLMAKVPGFAKAFAGRWRIIEMDNWDSDFLDLVEEAHLTFDG